MVTVASLASAMAPRLQVTVLVPLQDPRVVADETKLIVEGRVSVTVTPVVAQSVATVRV